MGLNRYFGGTPNLTNKPEGWVVREKFSPETNKIIALEFGIYVEDDRFISLPIHFSVKKSLLPTNFPITKDGEYDVRYYVLPTEINFKLSTLVSKNGKKFTLLTPTEDANESVALVAYAYFMETGSKIISFETNAVSIRDYIPKTRNYICGIFVNFESKIIKNKISYALSRHITHKDAMWTEYDNSEDVTDEVLSYEPKTQFIKFNRLMLNTPVNNEKSCDCDGKCEVCKCKESETK